MTPYTPDELRAKIASHEYGAELLLQHAMVNIERLEADARRLDWLRSRARQNTAHDVFGNGGHWSIGFFSDDNRKSFDAAIDSAMKDTP